MVLVNSNGGGEESGASASVAAAVNTAKDTMRDKMDVLSFHLSNQFERMQIHTTSFVNSANQRIYIIYENLLAWVESQDVPGKVRDICSNINNQGQEFITFVQSGQISQAFLNARAFILRNEVSKQAIYFGFAGLVTGSVIGLCIGYSFKSSPSSSSSPISDSSLNSLSMNGRDNIRMMKAIICFSPRSGIDGITLSSIPIPNITQPNQILIQVRATGIDNIDAKIANGYGHLLRQYFGIKSPNKSKTSFILGRECSGIVIDIGSKVTSFDINDRVWVCLPSWCTEGIMSEYVVVPEQYVGHKPRNISFEGAAVLPYALLVVWHKIIDKAELDPQMVKSKRILIHLGSASKNDSVGLTAIQIFKSWGARVTISTEEENSTSFEGGDGDNQFNHNNGSESDSASENDDEVYSISRSSRSNIISSSAQMTFLHTLKSLGAESHIIIPKDESLLPDLTQRIFDVVINTDSPQLTPLLQKFAKDPNGHVIETFPLRLDLCSRSLWTKVVPRFLSTLFSKKERMDEVLDTTLFLDKGKKLVETGQIVPVVAKSFLPTQYDQAFRHVSNLTRSALVQAHVGKSVVVFKIS